MSRKRKNTKALNWRSLAARTLHLLPRENLSRNLGRVADYVVPPAVLAPIVKAYTHVYDVDLEDAHVPKEGFQSFNEFFTRKLQPSARPLDKDPQALLCPADGTLEEVVEVSRDMKLRVKGSDYRVADLLGNDHEAAYYAGGHAFLIYLSPRDYHRVHAPVGGPVEKLRYVPGSLFPVNKIGVDHVPQLFARNERVVIKQLSIHFGNVSTVLIGALGVGRISVAFDKTLSDQIKSGKNVRPPERSYAGQIRPERGDELGMFLLGSSVLVLAPATGAKHLVPVRRVGESVKYGSALARRGGRA